MTITQAAAVAHLPACPCIECYAATRPRIFSSLRTQPDAPRWSVVTYWMNVAGYRGPLCNDDEPMKLNDLSSAEGMLRISEAPILDDSPYGFGATAHVIATRIRPNGCGV